MMRNFRQDKCFNNKTKYLPRKPKINDEESIFDIIQSENHESSWEDALWNAIVPTTEPTEAILNTQEIIEEVLDIDEEITKNNDNRQIFEDTVSTKHDQTPHAMEECDIELYWGPDTLLDTPADIQNNNKDEGVRHTSSPMEEDGKPFTTDDIIQVALDMSGLDAILNVNEISSSTHQVKNNQCSKDEKENNMGDTITFHDSPNDDTTNDDTTNDDTTNDDTANDDTTAGDQSNLSYKRRRERNNEACKKSRKRRKEKQYLITVQCEELQIKKERLTKQVQQMELDISNLKSAVAHCNLHALCIMYSDQTS